MGHSLAPVLEDRPEMVSTRDTGIGPEEDSAYSGLTRKDGQPFQYPVSFGNTVGDCSGYASSFPPSVSTSAGSSEPQSTPSGGTESGRRDAEVQCDSDNLYSQPMYVQNTFIHECKFLPYRPVSMEGFYKEREIHSASGSKHDAHLVTPDGVEDASQVLRLADVIASDGLSDYGLDEAVVSVGSCAHPIACKPCAFYHLKGCENGRNCIFCHVCDPGEKKRRKKEKAASKKYMRQIQQYWPFRVL